MAQTISVPDDLYERLRRAAAGTQRPIDDVARQALVAGLPPSADDAPAEYRDELRALEAQDDAVLWEVWRSAIPPTDAKRHHRLLAKEGNLTPEQREELAALRAEADRVMLCRAYAAALLRWRGHAIAPSL